MMNGLEKSDLAVVAMKPANNSVRTAAEWVEPRAGTEPAQATPEGVAWLAKDQARYKRLSTREKRNRPTRDGHSAAAACHRGRGRTGEPGRA